MLSEIKIKNFRCFDDCTFGQFGRINLIGGKNNAGKTTLLEALFLGLAPSKSTIRQIHKFRGESIENLKQYPEKTWESFFFNLEKDAQIDFELHFMDGINRTISITCYDELEDIDTEDPDFIQLNDDSVKVSKSILSINLHKDNKSDNLILEADNNGISPTERFSGIIPVIYIHSRIFFSPTHLAVLFETALTEYERLIDLFKVIDKDIVDARVFQERGATIKLKKKDGVWFPLSYYGDATYKITSIILKLLTNRDSILLIDEIENGLHFTSQKKYWTILFQITKRLNIQVFATSHSFEMISAFNEAALDNEWSNEAMYFEMARHIKTNEIFVNAMDMEMLRYELKTQSAFRGE